MQMCWLLAAVAGFTAALSAANAGAQVVLVHKDEAKITNTSWAQGHIRSLDEARKLATTVLLAMCAYRLAGAELCHEEAVRHARRAANNFP